MMKPFLTLLVVLLGLLPLASAQDRNHAKATLYAREVDGVVRIAIEVKIDKGWHLYHGPTKEEMGTEGAVGLPTTIEFFGDDLEFGEFRFGSAPHPQEQDFGEELKPTIYEHNGTVTIFAKATKTSPDAKLESISAAMAGQTCMDGPGGMCLPYEEEVRFKGAGKDELFANFAAVMDPAADPNDPKPAGAVHGAAGGATAPTSGTTTDTLPPSDSSSPVVPEDDGLVGFLLSAVFWGFFTLLMPCTYPMIPITISYFTKQATQKHTSGLTLSIVYGLGIIAIFVVIGLVIGQAIIPFAQHPVTNLLIGVVFVVFALSLFGLFNLQLPSFLMNAAGAASMKGGYIGVFLMGATLVVTSFTCTAPFVGALLGTGAASGDLGRIALGMAVFGATIAIPFAGLSMVPGKLKSMPKSGEWMHTLKVTMGFVELAAALKFLSNADLVWNWQFLSLEMFLFLWTAIFAVAAIYLFGLIRLEEENVERISPGRMVAGIFFAMLSMYSMYGAFGNKLDPIMTAIAPNYSNAGGGGGHGVSSATKRKGHTIVTDDYAAAVALAKSEKKLVLLNFTGVT
jgi:thiol:disulfide interchange protein